MTLSQRRKLANDIILDPEGFKVCECCGSIVTEHTFVCPNCTAYRFDTDQNYIIEQALKLAEREPRSIESYE